MPSTSPGRLRERRDPVDIERRGVGGENRAALHRPCRARWNTDFLTVEVFEHGFDDQVRLRRRGVVERRRDERQRASRRRRASACPSRPRLRTACGCRRCRDPAPPASLRAWSRECRHSRNSSRCRRPWCRRRSPRPLAILRCGVLSVRPATFDAARSAKNAWRSAFDSSLTMSSPNTFCSVAMPASNFCVTAAPTASSARTGARKTARHRRHAGLRELQETPRPADVCNGEIAHAPDRLGILDELQREVARARPRAIRSRSTSNNAVPSNVDAGNRGAQTRSC